MKRPYVALSLLMVLTAAVFAPAMFGDFLHWDDSTHIVNNTSLRRGDWMFFWREPYYRLYIPVIYTAWTMIAHFTMSPLAFHLFTLGLHLMNGFLVFRLTRLLLPQMSELGALAATAVFLLHPIQDEGAAWIGGGRDVLATAVALTAALILFADTKRPWLAALISTVLFVVGLLAKATLAPLPVALLLFSRIRERMNRPRWVAVGAWLIAAVVILYINKMVQQSDADRTVEPIALWARPIIAMDAMGFYFLKLLAPYPISSDYGRIPKLVIEKAMYIGPLIVFFTAMALIAHAFKKYKARFPAIAFLFFAFVLGPVMGMIPFMAQAQSTVANRYIYLAILGPAWLFGFAVMRWPKFRPVAVGLIVVWSGLSFARARVYADSETFFSEMLRYNPDSLPGQTTYGVVKFLGGRIDLAIEHFKEAHRIAPLNVSPVSNWAQGLWELRRYSEILTDIDPIFDNPEFIKYNENNKAALSRGLRVIAQSYIVARNFHAANLRLCAALEFDQTNAEAVADYLNFEREMKAISQPITPCKLPE